MVCSWISPPLSAPPTKSDTICAIWPSPKRLLPSLQVKIDELDEKWSGSVHVGLTTLLPSDAPYPVTGLPSSILELRSKVTWLVTGSEVWRNGILQKQNYGCSLERLGVSVTEDPLAVEVRAWWLGRKKVMKHRVEE